MCTFTAAVNNAKNNFHSPPTSFFLFLFCHS